MESPNQLQKETTERIPPSAGLVPNVPQLALLTNPAALTEAAFLKNAKFEEEQVAFIRNIFERISPDIAFKITKPEHTAVFVQFIKELGFETDFAERLFHTFDRNREGEITLDDLILGCAILDTSTPHSSDSPSLFWRLRYIFRCYNVSGTRKMTFEEFQILISHILVLQKCTFTDQDLMEETLAAARKMPTRGGKVNFIDRDMFIEAVACGLLKGTELLLRARNTPWRKNQIDHRKIRKVTNEHFQDMEQFQRNLAQDFKEELSALPTRKQREFMLSVNQQLLEQIYPLRLPFKTRITSSDQDSLSHSRRVKLQSTYDIGHNFDGYASCAPHEPVVNAKNSSISCALAISEESDLSFYMVENLASRIIQHYLLSEPWTPPSNRLYSLLNVEEVKLICDFLEKAFLEEDMCVRVSAPCKVFGDIHGQLNDLLEFFKTYGSPNPYTGDIVDVSYVFLGDFVDRGQHSVDVIMLLFALKIKFPTRVFLIRGNHEDRFINQTYGFYSEMNERFPDGVAVKLWEKINDVFDCLPIAALISDRILCVHGGTGQLESLEDIEKIKRPLRFSQNDETSLAAFHNILWSDPTDGPSEIGFHPNPARGTGIVKFGPDIVKQFIKKNNLDLIIRAHQACSAGYEFFAGGHLITVFSATNYCGKHGNNGAMLYISSELQIRPKIVKPKNEHVWPATQSAPPSPPRSPRI